MFMNTRKLYYQQYYIKNKDKINSYGRKYSIKNKEKIKARMKVYNAENKEKITKKNSERYLKNKEHILSVNKKWQQQNRPRMNANSKEWKLNNYQHYIEKARVASKKWRDKNKEKVKQYRYDGRQKRKLEAFEHYGIVCQCCGEKEFKFLVIDHVNNDGAKHRRDNKLGSSEAFYTWLRKNNYPSGFQTLCHNCNSAKQYYQICPHKLNKNL